MACFAKIAVFKMFYVTNMRKCNSITMLSNNCRYVVVRICVERTRTKGKAIVFIVYHLQETVDAGLVHQKSGQAENIPRWIVHVDGHFDVALTAGGHNCLQEILQVCPQLFFGDVCIRLEEFVQLRHSFRFPTREGHIVFFREIQDILRHRVVIVLDHSLFIEKGGRAVPYFVEQITTGPVKNRHKVITNHLHAKLG